MEHEHGENVPLVRVVEPRKSRFPQRMCFYTVVGIITLTVAQLIFLARTSAARDWDHLHHSRFSRQQVRRMLSQEISTEAIANFSRVYYNGEPHLGGDGPELLAYTEDKFREFGLETRLESYEVLLNRPISHRAALIENGKVVYELSLEEDVQAQDPATRRPDRIPTFHGYSASGNVTAEFVFANYGQKSDFEALENAGVSCEGKVVLMRYGKIYRGNKVLHAESRGAKAVLIYSDSSLDGDITTDNGYKYYPEGPARNPSMVERGMVFDLTRYPGDPTTPGRASHPGSDRSEPVTLPKIPSLPISYLDAKPLLEALEGHGPALWDGIYSGPSTLQVLVENDQEYDYHTITNVIGEIPGLLDEEVIVGNHRDAWILGGSDPNSGTATVMEVARVLGGLYKKGWRPYRTIVFASWDAEEYGMVGSTEWAEDHAHHLGRKALAYLNVDLGYSGDQFAARGSPLLESAIRDATLYVDDPYGRHESVYDDWMASPVAGVLPLGSGSDYTAFFNHLGIPSADLRYQYKHGNPAYHYHSNYDSLHWMETYGDPDYEAHAALSKVLALTIVNLVGHGVVPIRTRSYAALINRVLRQYLSKINTQEVKDVLETAGYLVDAASSYDSRLEKLSREYFRDYAWYHFITKFINMCKIKVANFNLGRLERSFLHKDGIDGRQWYKHVVFAPSRDDGYAPMLFPGLIEAIEDNDTEKLEKWIEIIHGKLQDVLNTIGN